jgi:diaminohydroxyphosphoribosylaminopyrimidine deaminase/5-amino-6-(5-phosphoribosylamino)uracil reductase
VIQLMVEGGATVAGEWHRRGLIDQYVIYFAPALAGGGDARPMFDGPAAPSMADLPRGTIIGVERIGPDLRIDLLAGPRPLP